MEGRHILFLVAAICLGVAECGVVSPLVRKLVNSMEVQDLGDGVKVIKTNARGVHDISDYYLTYVSPITWGEAFLICQRYETDLVVVDTPEEAELVTAIIGAHIEDGIAYIGLQDMYVEGTFVSIWGELLQNTTYNLWAAGQPDNGNGAVEEDCVILNNGQMEDVNCQLPYMAICESNNNQ